MSGKWDKLKGKYEPKPFEDVKFAEKVDAARLNYASMSLKDLLFHFNDRDHQKDQLNDQIKDLNVELAALGQLIKTHFENLDVHSVQTDFGKTIYLQSEPAPSVQDRPALEAHLASGPDLDYLWSINPQTLKTFIKGLLEQGLDREIPPGITVYYDTSVRIKKT
jgi:hypothetical protein